MTKNMMIKAISEFIEKEGVMDLAEYKSYGSEVPVKDYILKRYFGSWNRILAVVNKRYPVSVAPVEVEAPKKAPKVKVEKEDVE